MKLIYRGVTYDYNPPAVNYGDMSQTGTYRGVDVRFRNRQKPLVLPSTLKLIYRGHTYSPAQVAQASAPKLTAPAKLIYRGNTYVVNPAPVAAAPAEPVAPVTPAPAARFSINDRARQLMMNHHRDVKRRQQSMLTRLDARVGLPTSEASRFWNHIGGETHPAFGDSYDRSHVALS